MSKRPLSPNAKKPPAKKYYNKFNPAWKNEFKCIDRSSKGPEFAFCKSCKFDIKITHGGRNDIKRHIDTPSHKSSDSSVSQTPTLKNMFSAVAQSDPVARAETLFANYVAEHNMPFLVADHFSDLVKEMFPDSQIAQKFSCKRTKTTHIVTQALAPYFNSQVENSCKTEKFSVMIDESNDQGDDKMLAVLVRVYDQNIKRISTRFLGIPTCNIGTSENIFNCLNKLFIDRDIPWENCVGFSSDNCNVMIGRNNSVLTRVRAMNENVFDMGCVCHLANICVSKAVKTLPLPVDDLLTDVFFHFFHSSKRKEELKEFELFTDTEPLKLLKHCSTRWLSLEKCVKRLLHQWPALRSYFESHAENESGGRVQRCRDWLTSPEMWLYYAFLEFVLPILNDFNTMFQAGESMIGVMDSEMTRLLRKLLGRFVRTKVITAESDITKVNFSSRENQHDNDILAVGWRAREYINDEEVAPEITTKFFSNVRLFYSKVCDVMIKKFPFNDPTLKALGILSPATKEGVSSTAVQNLGARFLNLNREQLTMLEDQAQDYILTPKTELPSVEEGLEEFWSMLERKKTVTGDIQFDILCRLSRVLLTLPHSNADTERTFSVLRKIQQDSRGNLDQKTIESLLSCKVNNSVICSEFKPCSELVNSARKACSLYKQCADK